MILLKEIRVQRNLSQKALSTLTGVPQQTISAIESGERPNPGIDTVYQLAAGLGCDIKDLYRPEGREADT